MQKRKKDSEKLFIKNELAVIKLVCGGYTIEESAKRLKLTATAVETLRNKAYQRLGVNTIARLAVEAIKRGLYDVRRDKPKKKADKQKSIFTKQEKIIVQFLCDGYRYAAIAEKLKRTPYELDRLIESIQLKIIKSREKEKRTPLFTKEEIAIIKFTCDGYRLDGIARKLGLPEKSINDARQVLYKKVQVSNAASLAVYAIEKGIYDYRKLKR